MTERRLRREKKRTDVTIIPFISPPKGLAIAALIRVGLSDGLNVSITPGGFQRQPERVTEGPLIATSSHKQPL